MVKEVHGNDVVSGGNRWFRLFQPMLWAHRWLKSRSCLLKYLRKVDTSKELGKVGKSHANFFLGKRRKVWTYAWGATLSHEYCFRITRQRCASITLVGKFKRKYQPIEGRWLISHHNSLTNYPRDSTAIGCKLDASKARKSRGRLWCTIAYGQKQFRILNDWPTSFFFFLRSIMPTLGRVRRLHTASNCRSRRSAPRLSYRSFCLLSWSIYAGKPRKCSRLSLALVQRETSVFTVCLQVSRWVCSLLARRNERRA